jgi:hypothetical protein
VVYGSDDVEFELAVRRGLEDACVDLDFFDTRAVEFFQRSDDARLLSCTGGSVHEEMWKVAALCLYICVLDALCY